MQRKSLVCPVKQNLMISWTYKMVRQPNQLLLIKKMVDVLKKLEIRNQTRSKWDFSLGRLGYRNSFNELLFGVQCSFSKILYSWDSVESSFLLIKLIHNVSCILEPSRFCNCFVYTTLLSFSQILKITAFGMQAPTVMGFLSLFFLFYFPTIVLTGRCFILFYFH